MLIMIALTLDEVVAVCQYMARHKKQRCSRIFWKGGRYEEGELDNRSPPLNASFKRNLDAMLWGVSFSWNLLVSILLGGILMFTPTFLTIHPLLAPIDYVAGALVATFSFIAIAEVLRSVRFLNIAIGIFVLIYALFFVMSANSYYLFHILWSLLLIGVSFPKGRIKENYGTWNRFIR